MENNALRDYGTNDPGTPESVENDKFQDELASFIKKQFQRAEEHKRAIGIEERLTRNLYAKKCQYTPDQLSLIEAENNIYIGLCALKARAAESWLTDIILNNIDKPWTLASTPIPDLPQTAREQVLDLLVSELSTLTTLSDIKERAKELKTVALDQTKEIAEEATGKMEDTIADQLAQGGFSDMFTLLIQDISTYPSVFIRGPYQISKLVAKWTGDEYTAANLEIPDCRIISPFDAYPSPTSTTTQDGEFFIERTRLLPSDVYNSMNIKGFDEVNIRRALADYEAGFKLDVATDSTRDNLEDREQGTTQQTSTIDTLVYNGLVKGQWLIDHGVLVKDPQKRYEAEVWLAGDYVIKAVLNPNILGVRPIHSTSFIKINRNIWGQCVIDIVYDSERICNAAARSMTKNMAFASGPIIEANSERMEGQDPTELYPYKVFLVTPDLSGTGAPAIRFNNVESVLNDLLALFERFLKIADDLSGIPAYVLGNPNVAGAGRTLGGLSMLMGNAAKGIKNVQLNIDREIITPLITGFYVYNMLTSDDTAIKADAQVVARGATGLMQRELSQSRLTEVLQMLVPLIPMWNQLPEGVQVILREVLKQTGLPVDDIIKDPNSRDKLLAKIRELGQNEASDRGTSAPVALPPQSMPALGANTTNLASQPITGPA